MSPESKKGLRKFFLFGISGTLGFIVDAGIAQLLIFGLGTNFYLARLVSFLCAVTVTYVFNRRFTFADQVSGKIPGLRRRYLLAMVGGFVLNYGTYAALGLRYAFFHDWPVLAILAGSFAGLIANYSTSRYWVFRVPPDSPGERPISRP